MDKTSWRGVARACAMVGVLAMAMPVAGQPGKAQEDRYVCDMHCEPGKVSKEAGTCAVCRMKLRTWEDVGYRLGVQRLKDAAGRTLRLRVIDPSGADVKDLMPMSLEAWQTGPGLRVTAVLPGLKDLVQGRVERESFDAELPAAGDEATAVFAEFVPRDDLSKVRVAGAKIDPVKGTSSTAMPGEDYDDKHLVGEYSLPMRCNGKKFFAGETSFIRIGVLKDLDPVGDLEPVYSSSGVRGELVVVGTKPMFFERLTPLPIGSEARVRGGGTYTAELLDEARQVAALNGSEHDLVFATRFPAPGTYKVFLKVRHKGEYVRTSYVIEALKLTKANADEVPSHEGHEGHGK